MTAWLQRLPRMAAIERLSDDTVAAPIKALR